MPFSLTDKCGGNSSDNVDVKFTFAVHFWFFQFPLVLGQAASKAPSVNLALSMPARCVSFPSTQPGLISLLLMTRIQQKSWDATSGRRQEKKSEFCLCASLSLKSLPSLPWDDPVSLLVASLLSSRGTSARGPSWARAGALIHRDGQKINCHLKQVHSGGRS